MRPSLQSFLHFRGNAYMRNFTKICEKICHRDPLFFVVVVVVFCLFVCFCFNFLKSLYSVQLLKKVFFFNLTVGKYWT